MTKKLSNFDLFPSDLSLLQEIINGNNQAYEKLILRYKRHARFLAHELIRPYYGNTGIEIDDLVSIGLLAFLTSVKHFTFSKKVSFYRFWLTIATNKMREYIRQVGYQFGGKYFAGSISLDEYANDDSHTLNSELFGENDVHILGGVDYANREQSLSEILDKLSPFEQRVYLHLVAGQKPKAISKLLKADVQKVYRAIRKIRAKISNTL